MDLSSIKKDWIGRSFDHTEFHITAEDLLAYADACGETDTRFTDPSNPDFQGHPGYASHLVAARALPDAFPSMGNGRGVDGGKSVDSLTPIRAGDVLTATSEIADIYDKTGRSGTMVFIVHRMRYENQRGEPVAVVDWRMIRNVTG